VPSTSKIKAVSGELVIVSGPAGRVGGVHHDGIAIGTKTAHGIEIARAVPPKFSKAAGIRFFADIRYRCRMPFGG
jgi:hypothetical protein